MKKATTILLVMLILFQGAGMFFLLKLQQTAAAMSMDERINKGVDDDELTRFVFHRQMPKEVSWVHEREFIYGGNMYDVVNLTQRGDSVYIACVHDHKETKLLKKLIRIVKPLKAHPSTAAPNFSPLEYNWFCDNLLILPDDNFFLLILLPIVDPFRLVAFQPSVAAPPPKV